MGLSVEAALANVDALFRSVDRQVRSVLLRHASLRQWTDEALRRLEHDLETLAATPLHPRLRGVIPSHSPSPSPSSSLVGPSASASAAARPSLLDLVPQGPGRIRDWGQHCGRLSRAVEAKVTKFDADYRALGRDVETLLLRTPQSDLATLQGHVEATAAYMRVEARPILDALAEDFRQVEQLLHRVAEDEGLAHLPPPAALLPVAHAPSGGSPNVLSQLSSSVLRGAGRGLHFLESALGGASTRGPAALSSSPGPGPGSSPNPSPSPKLLSTSPRVPSSGFGVAAEALRALERMLERHAAVCGPVVVELERRIGEVVGAVAAGRETMLRDAHAHLAALAALQTAVRGLQTKARGLEGILTQWEEDAAQLGVLRRIPQAYRVALREALRQKEFESLFRLEAQKRAESLARARELETQRRRQVAEQTVPLLSTSVLGALGILKEPPLCEISVTGGGGGGPSLAASASETALPEVTQADFDQVDRLLTQRNALVTTTATSGSGHGSATASAGASPGPGTPSGPSRSFLQGDFFPPDAPLPGPSLTDSTANDPDALPSGPELELVRVKSELADLKCREALRELSSSTAALAGAGPSSMTAAEGSAGVNTPRRRSLGRELSSQPTTSATTVRPGPGPGPESSPGPLSQSQAQSALQVLREGLRAKDALLAAVYSTVSDLKGTLARQERRIRELEELLERGALEAAAAAGGSISVAAGTPITLGPGSRTSSGESVGAGGTILSSSPSAGGPPLAMTGFPLSSRSGSSPASTRSAPVPGVPRSPASPGASSPFASVPPLHPPTVMGGLQRALRGVHGADSSPPPSGKSRVAAPVPDAARVLGRSPTRSPVPTTVAHAVENAAAVAAVQYSGKSEPRRVDGAADTAPRSPEDKVRVALDVTQSPDGEGVRVRLEAEGARPPPDPLGLSLGFSSETLLPSTVLMDLLRGSDFGRTSIEGETPPSTGSVQGAAAGHTSGGVEGAQGPGVEGESTSQPELEALELGLTSSVTVPAAQSIILLLAAAESERAKEGEGVGGLEQEELEDSESDIPEI